jgi:hypothetical protein
MSCEVAFINSILAGGLKDHSDYVGIARKLSPNLEVQREHFASAAAFIADGEKMLIGSLVFFWPRGY